MSILQIGSTVTGFDNAMPTSLTVSYTQAAGSNRVLLVIVGTEPDATHDSVTFDGVALTKEADSFRVAQRRTTLWYLAGPNVTTANIVITLGAAADVGMIAHSWEEVNQSTVFNASAINNNDPPPDSDGNPTITVASAAGELAIDGFAHDDETNPVPAGGQTELADLNIPGDMQMASSRKDGAAPNVTFDWTMSPNDWTAVAGSLNPAAPPVVPDQPIQMVM